MKKTLCLLALVMAPCAFADGAKLVVNCQENQDLGQNSYSLQSLQVFQDPDGDYRYSALITPSDQNGAAIGPSSYFSSGPVAVDLEKEDGFESQDGSISIAWIGCFHHEVFSDSAKNMGMGFGWNYCQFNR